MLRVPFPGRGRRIGTPLSRSAFLSNEQWLLGALTCVRVPWTVCVGGCDGTGDGKFKITAVAVPPPCRMMYKVRPVR